MAALLAAAAPASPTAAAEPSLVVDTPRQWRVSEFTFTGHESYSYQPLAVQLTATFYGPNGGVYQVPGYWDGDRTWRIRFTPDQPGRWTYETQAVEGKTTAIDQLYDSGVVRGGGPAARVDLDIHTVHELRLYVDDAKDGTAHDHADWADAKIISADGTATYLETLAPLRTSQGHGKLGRGTNVPGGDLRIGGRKFEHGLGTHATSEIVYRLPPNPARFQAWVGVDDVTDTHGSVRFRVVRQRVLTANAGRHDSGLDGQRGSFTAASAESKNSLFRHGGILRVSDNHRYLTYADGTPFFWLGDTWWFCPSDLLPIDGSSNPEIASAYKLAIATRRREGFTVVQMDFLDRLHGASAFADFPRTRTISIPFWRSVDRYIAGANDARIVPVIGMGWNGRPLNPNEWHVLWRYVVARYGACGVTWLVCGEYNVQHTSDRQIAETLKLGAFIKSIDPWKRAMSIHPWYFRGDRRQAWRESWYDFIMLQGGHGDGPPVDVYDDAWKSKPTRPVIEGECAYEGIHTFTADDVRNRAWRAMQSGCCGYTYGSHGMWYPTQDEHDTRTKEWGRPTPWWIALKRPGAEQMGRMRAIYESVPWWQLEPLPKAIAMGLESSAETGTVHDEIDLAGRLDDAKPAHALWCKVIRHPWVATDLPEIELHPRGGPAATLTWQTLSLPAVPPGEALRLVLALGMDPAANLNDPEHPSDGVIYVVTIDGKTLLREHLKTKKWTYRCLNLTAFAGRSVTLVLATEAGKSSDWDHARFRAPRVVRTSRDLESPRRNTYTAPLPPHVLVKAAGAELFVVYLPASEQMDRPGLLLHGLAPGCTYTAAWHDPRTGKSSATGVIRGADHGTPVPLPAPPDRQDWVLILRHGS